MNAAGLIKRIAGLFETGISKVNTRNSIMNKTEVDARKGLAIMTDILGTEKMAEYLDFKNQSRFTSVSHTYNDVRKKIIKSIKNELSCFITEDNRVFGSIGINIRINLDDCGLVILLNHMPKDRLDLWSRLMIVDNKLGILDLDGLFMKDPSYIPVDKSLSKEEELKYFTLLINKVNENMNIIKETLQIKFNLARQGKKQRFKVVKRNFRTSFA